MRNKNIIITGGSSGLGLALAERLAKHNSIMLVARNAQKLEDAVSHLKAKHNGTDVRWCAVDVSKADATEKLQQAAESMGSLDVLINSAGILREGYFEAISEQDFRDTIEINFFGTVTAVRALLPQLKESRGHIVNIASVAALTGVFGYTAYCSSKFALMGFTDSLRYELASKGVQVQIVCPPEFDSPMVDDLDKSRTAENKAHTLAIPKLTIDQCAEGVMKGMNSKRRVIIPGIQTRLMATGMRYFPGISRMVAEGKISAVQR